MNDDEIVEAIMADLGITVGGTFSINPDQLGMNGEQFDALVQRLVAAGGGERFSIVHKEHKRIYTATSGWRHSLLWLQRDC